MQRVESVCVVTTAQGILGKRRARFRVGMVLAASDIVIARAQVDVAWPYQGDEHAERCAAVAQPFI